jgi:hypothetical protein
MIYLCEGGVLHIVTKLLTKATTFLKNSTQLEVYRRHYGLPKLWEPPFW